MNVLKKNSVVEEAKLLPCRFQLSNSRVCSYFVFDFSISESRSFSFKLNETNYSLFYKEIYSYSINPLLHRLSSKFNVLVDKTEKKQAYLFRGVFLESTSFIQDIGMCSFFYDVLEIKDKLSSSPEIYLTYTPLYSIEPICFSDQKTELELIEEELDLWLTNPAEFFDKKISGNIKYL